MAIEYAPQDRVDRYPVEVERILRAVGLSFDEVALSDESILSDFYMGDEDGFSEADLQRLSLDFGMAVHADSVIADLAEALHTKQVKG